MILDGSESCGSMEVVGGALWSEARPRRAKVSGVATSGSESDRAGVVTAGFTFGRWDERHGLSPFAERLPALAMGLAPEGESRRGQKPRVEITSSTRTRRCREAARRWWSQGRGARDLFVLLRTALRREDV